MTLFRRKTLAVLFVLLVITAILPLKALAETAEEDLKDMASEDPVPKEVIDANPEIELQEKASEGDATDADDDFGTVKLNNLTAENDPEIGLEYAENAIVSDDQGEKTDNENTEESIEATQSSERSSEEKEELLKQQKTRKETADTDTNEEEKEASTGTGSDPVPVEEDEQEHVPGGDDTDEREDTDAGRAQIQDRETGPVSENRDDPAEAEKAEQKDVGESVFRFDLILRDIRDGITVYRNGEKVLGIFGNNSPGTGSYYIAGPERPEVLKADNDSITRITMEAAEGDVFRIETARPLYASISFTCNGTSEVFDTGDRCSKEIVIYGNTELMLDGDYSGSEGFFSVKDPSKGGKTAGLRSSSDAPVMPDSMWFWLGDCYDDYSSTAMINGHTGVYFFEPEGAPDGLYVAATCGNTYKHMESGTHWKVARIAESAAREYLDWGSGCCTERAQRALAWLTHHGQTEYDWRVHNEGTGRMADGRISIDSQLEAYTITFLASWVLTNDGRSGDYGTVHASDGAAALDNMLGSAFSTGLPYSTKHAIDEMVEWALEFADRYTDPDADIDEYKETYIYSDGYGDHQPLLVGAYRGHAFGEVSVKKESSASDITDGNAMYSFEGTEFTVKDSSGNVVGTLTADAAGETDKLTLQAGTYTVTETKAGEGYKLNTMPQIVEVKAYENNVVNFLNDPLFDPAGLHIAKWDSTYDRFVPQGAGTFQGARYRLDYYDNEDWNGDPKASWVFESDVNGAIYYLPKYKVDGPDLYEHNGAYILPLGSVKITEIQAPEGYLMSTEELKAVIVQNGEGARFTWTEETQGLIKAFSDGTGIPETPIRSSLVIGKTDYVTGQNIPQGDASLAGAEFTIFADEDMEIDGVPYAKGDAVLTIVTGEDGIARTADRALPYGSYTVKETKAPEGYLLNDDSISFRIETDGQVIDLTDTDSRIREELIYGGAVFRKVDSSTGGEPQGCGTLQGAEITVFNESERSVWADGKEIGTGEAVCVLTTDEKGYASTDGFILPYGTYSARETKPSEGYELNEEWNPVFSIRENGVTVDLTGGSSVLPEKLIRGDLSLIKLDVDGAPMANIPFMICALDRDGSVMERHVIISDENGKIDTSSSSRLHSHKTNSLDGFTDGAVFYYDDMLDPAVGVWFGEGETDDGHGALPYGPYRIYELQCGTTRDMQMNLLQTGIETVDSEHRSIHFGAIVDLSVELESDVCCAETGFSVIPQAEEVNVRDTVIYRNLSKGRRYTLETRFVLKDDIMTELGSCSTEFIPEGGLYGKNTSSGTVTSEAVIDTSTCPGHMVVAFGRLYEWIGDSKVLIACHEDPDDVRQQLRIPGISTQARDNRTGDNAGTVSEDAGIIDTVTYMNLKKGETFRLAASLADPLTGEIITGPDGKPCTAEKIFTCGAEQGAIEMPEIKTDTRLLAGGSAVVLERLYMEHDGKEILMAYHEELNDSGQTVSYPSVRTIAYGRDTGDHTAPSVERTVIEDKVNLKGLVPGLGYEVKGTLMLKSTGKPVAINGKKIVSSTVFTADSSETEIVMEFVFDGRKLAGETVVIFEELFHNGTEIASHEDIDDEDQSVNIIGIKTFAKDRKTGGKEMILDSAVVISDTIRYMNLTPGRTYTLKGTVISASDGCAVAQNGEFISSGLEFIPEEPDGEVEMIFVLDTNKLQGEKLVVFEKLYTGSSSDNQNGDTEPIATHEDINDEGQTVYVPEAPEEVPDTDGDPHLGSAALMMAASGAGLLWIMMRRRF